MLTGEERKALVAYRIEKAKAVFIIYTLQEWATRIHSPFHNNVESEGILLC